MRVSLPNSPISTAGLLFGKFGIAIASVVALVIVLLMFQLPSADEALTPARVDAVDSKPVVTAPVEVLAEAEAFLTQDIEIESVPALNDEESEPESSLVVPPQEFPVSNIDAKDKDAQVAQAKAAAEAAERFNQQKLSRLQEALTEDASEVESLAKVEISYLVNQWRDAWAKGNTDAYLKFYSEQFVPDKQQSLAQWQNQRRNRVMPSKSATIRLSNFKVSFDEALSKSNVEFDQHFESGRYNDQSRKKLVFVKESQGWKLVSEVALDKDS
jgi:ketosteroid isomerase-like protein